MSTYKLTLTHFNSTAEDGTQCADLFVLIVLLYLTFASLVEGVCLGGVGFVFIFAIKANDYDDRDTKSR